MEPNAVLNVVLNAELGESGARMWNCMAFNPCLMFFVDNDVVVLALKKP